MKFSKKSLKRWGWMLGVLLVLGTGCGDAEDSENDNEQEEETALVESTEGHFQANFTHEPASPETGENELQIELFDEAGDPVAGATISVEPWMPAHGHGSPETPAVMEMSDHYHVTNIVYSMPGDWELRVDVDADDVSDQFVVDYSVQ